MTTTDLDALRAQLMTLGDEMLPLIEFAEGQQRILIERGWSEEAAAQHAFLVLCDLRNMWFAAADRNALTTELRTRKMEQLT